VPFHFDGREAYFFTIRVRTFGGRGVRMGEAEGAFREFAWPETAFGGGAARGGWVRFGWKIDSKAKGDSGDVRADGFDGRGRAV